MMMAPPIRKPKSAAAAKPAQTFRAPVRRPDARLFRAVLQRKEGGRVHESGGCRCESCVGKANGTGLQSKPGIGHSPESVSRVVGSSGRPLESGVRHDMEQRFGHDFSHVRVHRDGAAAQSAREVGALAYTLGSNVVFGAGQYRPETSAGRFTLAHELAHVVQQQGGSGSLARRANIGGGSIAIGRAGDNAEREADRAAEAVLRAPLTNPAVSGGLGGEAGPVLRRRLVVNPTDVIPLPGGMMGPPRLLTNAVDALMHDLCPTVSFSADPSTGVVSAPAINEVCNWHPPMIAPPAGCECLCGLVHEAKTTTIRFRPGPPGTSPASQPMGPGVAGSGGVKTDAAVAMDPRWQIQHNISGSWVDVPFYIVFSHELCGHALPKMKGEHGYKGAAPAGGTPPHETYAVDIERRISAEHNPAGPRRPDDYHGGVREKP